MNERIKQLYERAMEQHVSNNSAWEELNPEKFAELIVRECISTLDRDDGATHHRELLLEHFGVEE